MIGLNVIAKNGRLIPARAYSCTWSFVFFDGPSEAQAFQEALGESRMQRTIKKDLASLYLAYRQKNYIVIAESEEPLDVVA